MIEVNKIYTGDCLEIMRGWPDSFVQCVVTSPPYWGLRDYGVDGQLGLEKTPEDYTAKMAEIFREVKRVLRDDGTLWLNLGDTYAGGGRGFGYGGKQDTNLGCENMPSSIVPDGLKPKDLCGIPWRVAFALQADGWYLRSDIIWSKLNPMPESVTDRPTKAHEYLFLMSKNARYYYDAEAVKESAVGERWGGHKASDPKKSKEDYRGLNHNRDMMPDTRNLRSVWSIATQPFSDWTETYHPVHVELDDVSCGMMRIALPDCPVHGYRGRLHGERATEWLTHIEHTDACRDLKQLLSHPDNCEYRGPQNRDYSSDCFSRSCFLSAIEHSKRNHKTDHVPETTIPCTSFSEKFCHIVHTSNLREIDEHTFRTHENNILVDSFSDGRGTCPLVQISYHISNKSLPISPDCTCLYYHVKTDKSSHFATFPEDLIKPCIKAGTRENDIVLDPFMGSGTTALTALKLNRRFIGIELNPDYVAMANHRIEQEMRQGKLL